MGGLFGGGGQKVAPITPPPPLPDNQSIERAQRSAVQLQMMKSGRMATIMTNQGDNTKLGA